MKNKNKEMNGNNRQLKINFHRCIVSLFLLLFIVSSCNRTGMKKPDGHLLSKQEMEEMLLEVYLIEGKTRVLVFNMSTDTVRTQLNYEMKKLFERYNTTYTDFVNSYSYYMGDASVSKKMVANITNRLIVMEAEQTEKKKLIDSLTVEDSLIAEEYEENTNG